MFEAEEEKGQLSREYFFELVEKASTEEDVADLVLYFSTLEGTDLGLALPSLCILATKCSVHSLKECLAEICFRVIIDADSLKGSRKAAYSCLKQIYWSDQWTDFYILAECLEEPQFHIIRPILPRFENVLNAAVEGLIDPKWASLILTRSMQHTNGWIRMWGVEQSTDTRLYGLAKSMKHIFSFLLPILNSNDIFWRLLETAKLENYLKDLIKLFEFITNGKTHIEQGMFFTKLLMAIEQLSCPLTFYYISTIIFSMKTGAVLPADSASLMRRVVLKAQKVQFPVMKSVTIFQFCSFFSRVTILSEAFLLELGDLSQSFTDDCPALFDKFLDDFKLSVARGGVSISLDDAISLFQSTATNMKNASKLLWAYCDSLGVSDRLLANVCLKVTDLLEDEGRADEVNALLPLLLDISPPETLDRSVVFAIFGFVLMQVATSQGSLKDIEILREMYIPFTRKFKKESFLDLLEAIYPAVCRAEETLNTGRRAHVAIVLQEMLLMDHNDFSLKLATECLGTNLLSPTLKRSSMSLSNKEFALICSEMHAASLDILMRFLPELVSDYESLFPDVLEQLDCASSYSVKEKLLNMMEILTEKLSQESVKLSAINACYAVVNEEKKSLNSIPSLAILFRLGTRKDMLQIESINERMKELYLEFMDISNLSHSVALVICTALFNARDYLDKDWAYEVVRLAIFGPVPKKESRVLSDVYSTIYSGDLQDVVGSSNLEKVHEIVSKTRALGIELALHCCARSSDIASSLVREILEESILLDKSSSKSFGLSLAHRQKTRAMALLLLCFSFVKDKSVLDEVLQHCLDCIADPCQQFSIKLIVEWIVVRMCLADENYKTKIYSLGPELAGKRIGSVSSWINILLHYTRVTEKEEDICNVVSLIVPWTTAQNFGVRCTALAASNLIYRRIEASFPALLTKFELLKSIVEFSEEPAGNSQRIIGNLLEDFYFYHLHMLNDYNWETLMITLPLKTGLPAEETIPLNIIKCVTEASVPLLSADNRLSEASSVVYSGVGKNASFAPDMASTEENEPKSTVAPENNGGVQRKIVTKEKKKPDDCSLIVVASLIDKPNNLGGLCRTCEIFGVDSMVVADLLLTSDTGFKALSMSSENWQKLEAVRPDQLAPYLQDLRAQGYTVIAAEQTTDSVPMHEFLFPKKSVILMGDEKEGVPTQLLRCVDKTVEIEQLGQTRSLNVHVTAALFISKYAEQVLFK